MNPAAQALLEMPSGANISPNSPESAVRPFVEYLNGKPLRPDQMPMQRAVATRQPVFGAEIDIVMATGGVRHIYGNAVPLFDASRAVTGCVGVFLDITQHKLAEQALRESEERFRKVADNAPVGIFRTDDAGAATYVNQCWCAMVGLTPEQSMGTRWLAAVHPDDREQVLADWDENVRAGKSS